MILSMTRLRGNRMKINKIRVKNILIIWSTRCFNN